jgi:hypothetical protein
MQWIEMKKMMKISLFLISIFILLACGDKGGNAPDPVSCGSGGLKVGGYCWYLGAINASCVTTCAGHGAYDTATQSYAGSSGTNADCQSVLSTLGVPSGAFFAVVGGGLGCYVDTATGNHARDMTATLSGTVALGVRRACACSE